MDIFNLVLLSLSWCVTFVDFEFLRLLKEVMIEWALKYILLNSINLCLPLNVPYRAVRNLHLLNWRKKWGHMILVLHYRLCNIEWINCTHMQLCTETTPVAPCYQNLGTQTKVLARCHSLPSEEDIFWGLDLLMLVNIFIIVRVEAAVWWTGPLRGRY